MSGICGFRSLAQGQRFRFDLLAKMLARLTHRGPDAITTFPNGRAGLGHARLAVVDVAGGAQPFFSEDRRVAVVCDGRIYNAAQLRAELQLQGHCFETDANSEVLAHLWEEHGRGMLQKLRGMFALALIDNGTSTLFLARDTFGQKPIFYHRGERGLTFASEIAALCEVPEVELEWDAVAVDEYFSTGDLSGARTLLHDVQQLPAGHCLLQCGGQITIHDWTRAGVDFGNGTGLPGRNIEETLLQAVSDHLVGDEEALLLLDESPASQLLLAGASRLNRRSLETCSVSVGDASQAGPSRLSDAAAAFGMTHTEILLRPGDVPQLLEEAAGLTSQPLTDSTQLPLLWLARQCQDRKKVILTGEGGENVFAGTEWERNDRRAHQAGQGVVVAQLTSREVRQQRHETVFSRGVDRDWFYTAEQMHALGRSDAGPGSSVADASGSLRRFDVGHEGVDGPLAGIHQPTMAYGIETRTPFLDATLLVSLGCDLPRRDEPPRRKARTELTTVARQWLPAKGKHTSQVQPLPLSDWLRGELRGWVQKRLVDNPSDMMTRVQPECVQAILDEHNRGTSDHASRIYSLLALDLWSRNHMG